MLTSPPCGNGPIEDAEGRGARDTLGGTTGTARSELSIPLRVQPESQVRQCPKRSGRKKLSALVTGSNGIARCVLRRAMRAQTGCHPLDASRRAT